MKSISHAPNLVLHLAKVISLRLLLSGDDGDGDWPVCPILDTFVKCLLLLLRIHQIAYMSEVLGAIADERLIPNIPY